MKQIFCITAYKEFDYLQRLAKSLSGKDCRVYIHLDKKVADDLILHRLNGISGVTAISKYKVPWGSYQHL